MSEEVLILASGLVLIYGMFSQLLERSVVTPPMAFMAVGVLCGPLGLGLVDVDIDNSVIALLATIALVIIVCSDASQVDRREIRKAEALPIRLLFLGLPLTMLLGAGVASLVFDGFELAALAALAVLLSPTDAALGQAVITSEAVPQRIREALNVESGLNDGIALPPLFALFFMLGAALGDSAPHGWLVFGALQLLLGPLAGALIGTLAGRAIEWAADRSWVDPSFCRLSLPAIALLSYGLAEAIGGNGFIAAFVSGFTLAVRPSALREQMQSFAETEGAILSLLVFLVLGLVLIPETFHRWTLTTTFYALLSLTVVRMIPVALCLAGLGLDWKTLLFVGWFGPRGIASVVYVILFVQYLGVKGNELLLATGVQTIALSVLLHGLTAGPLAKRYGAAETT